MSEHTKEPWLIGETCKDEIGTICKDDTQGFGMIVPHCNTFGDNYEVNARRIVSCVNACAGLTQDNFDGGWTAIGLSSYTASLETQRDELLEKLRFLVDNDSINDSSIDKEIKNLIAKCESKL